MISKYHLLFWPQFVLHYIALLDCISLFPLEEVILTCLKRLQNTRIKFLRDCLMQRHHLWLTEFTTCECTAGEVSWVNIPACAPWLCDCSHRIRPWRDLWWDLLCSHAGLCFHPHIQFEDPPLVLCFPINASIQGVMMGLQALMISPCSPHWGPYRCCASLCNNSLGAKGWGFHLHLRIGEEKRLHHQIPKTLVNLSFPIDKADVQWERKTNGKRSEGICLQFLAQPSMGFRIFFAFLLCSGHFLHCSTVLL